MFSGVSGRSHRGFFSPAISGMTVLALKPVPLSESQGSLRKVYPAYVIFNVALRIYRMII